MVRGINAWRGLRVFVWWGVVGTDRSENQNGVENL